MVSLGTLPKQCEVLGNTITIVAKRIVLDDNGLSVNGTYEAEKNAIEISTAQPVEKQWQTLFHELYHVILNYSGQSELDKDETHVELAAQIGFQIARTLA